ncbi:hypothetical protein [Streptomyces sp. x-80]|uniref:hypothetical protein n=1 Tax=Streptomyces sp. x-80 TaxID=2789282 RepID=UPI003980E7D7
MAVFARFTTLREEIPGILRQSSSISSDAKQTQVISGDVDQSSGMPWHVVLCRVVYRHDKPRDIDGMERQ